MDSRLHGNDKAYKKRGCSALFVFLFFDFYASFGAPTGHAEAQAPQSIHLSASIT
jgi:hypothetical protein